MNQLGKALIKTAAAKTMELMGRPIPERKVDAAFTTVSRIKESAVSDEQAQSAINRLDTLERNKPTVRQAARYGAIGAVAGPAVAMLGNRIQGKPVFSGTTVTRSIAGDAAKGAVAAGAVPMLRSHLDRNAEVGTLKNYLTERQKEAAFVNTIKQVGGKALTGLHHLEDPIEVGGLAALAAPSVDSMLAKRRAAAAGDNDVEKHRLIKSRFHDPIEAGGLGVLALPSAAHMLMKRAELTTKEHQAFREAVKQHARFDAGAAGGNQSETDKARMRHNVERIKHFSSKKKDSSHQIPSWVHDPQGAPPAARPRSYSRSGAPFRGGSSNVIKKLNRGILLAYGAATVGAIGANVYKHHKKKQREATAKKKAA